MNTQKLMTKINLELSPIAIKLEKQLNNKEITKGYGCFMKKLMDVSKGETFVIGNGHTYCNGATRGCGFIDVEPDIPGGFGYFLSCGRGKGYPEGEKVKKNPDIASEMMKSQPLNVLGDNKYIVLKPYEDGQDVDTVAFIVNPDQISALIHLFNYENSSYDNVIAPMCSGCASVFRIPFDEAKKDKPRAVIGNVDIFSRPHLPADSFIFVVPNKIYKKMLEYADDCFFDAKTWNGVKARI